MKSPKSPKSPRGSMRSPRSPKAASADAVWLTEYTGDGRATGARRRLADALAHQTGGAATGPAAAAAARQGLSGALAAAFLPEGYPASVTPDYGPFVWWHCIQGLSSYIRGILSSHAVLRGVGVGNEAATALGAVFQFFVRDVVGMAGGILFAAAGDFQAYSKQWRLFADVANDVAMAIDLASPLVPGAFLLLACLGSLARALVGTASGATHAALTQHFAAAAAAAGAAGAGVGGRRGGGGGSGGAAAADLTAKADSRERAITIVGSVIGMALTRAVADNVLLAWAIFVVLTWLHIWANVRLVRCLVLTTLNVPRLELLMKTYLDTGCVLSPSEAGAAESLLAPPFRRTANALLHRGGRPIVFGARPAEALRAAASTAVALSPAAGEARAVAAAAAAALGSQRAAARGEYFITFDARGRVLVVLGNAADEETRLRAYAHALYISTRADGADGGETVTAESEEWMSARGGWAGLAAGAVRAGWRFEGASLPRPAWTAKWT